MGGNDDALPEGWGNGEDEGGSDVDMEVTFTPGLSTSKEDKDETTLEKYQRKAREKKKQRKEERKGRVADSHQGAKDEQPHDDFFGVDSEGEGSEDETVKSSSKGKKSSGRKSKGSIPASDPEPRHVSTAEELALVASSDNPAEEPKHFDLKAVLKAEKSKTKKRKDKKKRKTTGGDDEIQEDFAINVRDDRFKAVHEDSTFAIDPSNPQYVLIVTLLLFVMPDSLGVVLRRQRACQHFWRRDLKGGVNDSRVLLRTTVSRLILRKGHLAISFTNWWRA